ncbi:Low-density lipoprotein receptor-related protein 1-like 11 [Homarus americanus]|uniref:Low-density lipoprotein receptor-related protein 1-like 11 n=1 Tax=Homarus americanus TaxID=6706 RepID=A0A8J5T101_HOMAM|nr:Low-density lipoprotein receptor-related protein 1-like 11 [Homarus americanus]
MAVPLSLYTNTKYVCLWNATKGVQLIFGPNFGAVHPALKDGTRVNSSSWRHREQLNKVQLLLTSCSATDFTCSDGSCIKKSKRCDQEVDCPDNTDELNCDLILLPKGYSKEIAPPARFDKLWLPDILVKDGTYSPTDLQMRRVRLLVRRDADPLPDDDSNYSEDELYRGEQHGEAGAAVYSYAYVSVPAQAYPFDSQRCSLVTPFLIRLWVTFATTGGGEVHRERRLHELVNETLTAHGNMSAAVQLAHGHHLLPHFFFDLDDFTDRIMVPLTSLLVLAALFTQTSQSIPKTAYLKLIDIWYVTLIITDFLIIVMLVFIENQRMQENCLRLRLILSFKSAHKIMPRTQHSVYCT